MSVSTKKMENTYSGKLALFADELGEHIDDERMLREVHKAIAALLAGGVATEREIRSTLQRHLDSGDLREESFELVQKLIDRIVLSNDQPQTSSVTSSDDQFSSTAVIQDVSLTPGDVSDNLQVGSVLRDRFMLLEEVRGGSMGSVYKAMDRRLAEAGTEDHTVAIKVLSPKLSRDGNALRALQQEAAKTRCLTHPNIVRFIDLDRDDELYFMVLEWLPGRSLATILDDSKHKKIDLETSLDIVRQVAAALEYAHQRGVVHADVKPGNIIITPDGTVKLFDFGIARIQQKQSKVPVTFDLGVIPAMSPAYSSMQVLTGDEPVAADDVFSLACLAYRLIAGYRVFGPRNAAEAAEAGMEPQRLDVLSKSQWAALKKALSFARVTRFSSPAEFVGALLSDPAAVIAPVQDDRWVTEQERGTRLWPYAALLLTLIAGAGYYYQDQIRDYVERALPVETTVASGSSAGAIETMRISDAAVTADDIDNIAVDSGAEVAAVSADGDAQIGLTTDTTPAIEGTAEALPPVEIVEPETAAADGRDLQLNAQPDVLLLPVDTDLPLASSSAKTTNAVASDQRPADATIILAVVGAVPETTTLEMIEDGKPLIVDFSRTSYLNNVMSLRVVETAWESNESPLKSRQYFMSDSGVLDFGIGQATARLVLTMASNPIRESDIEVTLQVVHVEYPELTFATIKLTLADDDQLEFEKSLSSNTVAFAVSQISVRESDSAAQIDLIRFKPDQTALDVPFTIRGVTATEGDDFLDLGEKVVRFAPGQRSARILVPLIQDSRPESDEAFMLEIDSSGTSAEANIFTRIAVMIRDDDS